MSEEEIKLLYFEENGLNYNSAIKFLKESMMYQMSLGSKELFHSNIWWWLIDNDKNFIKVFLPDFEPTEYSIWSEREAHNRDIIIWLEDNNKNKSHIVIENKIKALPTYQQLQKYTTALGNNSFKNGVLTGIGPCSLNLNEIKDEFGVSNLWSYVSYNEIAKRIREIAVSSESTIIKNHLDQIQEYCDILECLNLILDENINRHKDVLTYEYDYDTLKVLRIADIFKKHKGAQFLNYIIQHKDELEKYKPAGYDLKICQSFHNNRSTLDVRFSNWKDEKTDYKLLGVQIEGDQFRIVGEKNINFGNVTPNSFYDSLKDVWFDDSYDKNTNRSVFGNQTSMKPRNNQKYDSYNTNTYCFVYQYFDVNKVDRSYESLFEMIKYYIAKASKLLMNK